MERMREIEILKDQLAAAIINGGQNGDLSTATTIQTEIKTRITTLTEKLYPLRPLFQSLHPELKKQVERGGATLHQITIGGKSALELVTELETKNFEITAATKNLVVSPGFTLLSQPQPINLICLETQHLGLDPNTSIANIYKKALEFDLELCPAEVAPHWCLRYPDLFSYENAIYQLAMEPIISYSSGTYNVFRLASYRGQQGIGATPAELLDTGNYQDFKFIFQLPRDNSNHA